ncbi:MAG: HPP family protein [Candidatus Neomarinimicrobiota bacterium]
MNLDEKFSNNWRPYVYQSLYAAVSIFIIILVLQMQHAVVIASIGATAFIVFSMPNDIAATPRRVIGGHFLGLVSGAVFSMLTFGPLFFSALVYSLAVGIALFAMVLTDTEHPPAAGTALGVALTGFSIRMAVAVMASVIILSLIHRFARPHIKDLV